MLDPVRYYMLHREHLTGANLCWVYGSREYHRIGLDIRLCQHVLARTEGSQVASLCSLSIWDGAFG
jgi:hypothetical protein